jgi:uncharacterized phage infection (PIP) family protein YhgE
MTKENKTQDVPELDLDTFVNEYGQDTAPPAPVETPPVEPAPDPAPAPALNVEAELEALKSGYAEREKQYQEVIDQQNSRMNTLETLVNQGYQRAHAEPPKPEIPTYTEEELRTDPVGTIERMSDAKARAAIQTNNEQLSQVIGGLVERSWQGELKGISAKPYYNQVKDEIEGMVKQNPNLKLQPNSAELAYNMITGRMLSEGKLQPLAKPTLVPPLETPAPVPSRVPTPLPTTSGPAGPVPPEGDPPKKEVELTDAQKRLQAKFAGLDIGLVASDFEAGA